MDNVVLLDFSIALNLLKEGKKLSRRGWNGKDMFILKAGGYSVAKDKLREGSPIDAQFLEAQGVEELEILPHIDMWTADNKYVSGWHASQTDLFAEDWFEVA